MHVSIYKFFSLFKCKMLLWSELLPKECHFGRSVRGCEIYLNFVPIGVNEVGQKCLLMSCFHNPIAYKIFHRKMFYMQTPSYFLGLTLNHKKEHKSHKRYFISSL